MRAKGISYDTGFVLHGEISRDHLDPDVVKRELAIIRDDLHCTAVRIIGGDPARIELAATIAADLGLEVWFSPYPLELTPEELLSLLADCASRAERLRQQGANVVFVTGAELSLMNKGFLPGANQFDRLELLLTERDRLPERVATASTLVNEFLTQAASVVRQQFAGKLSYASIPLERVDWTPFDIVSVDLYRSAEIADQFTTGVQTLVSQGKPVAITEFGTATYSGAGAHGGRTMEICEFDRATGKPLRIKGNHTRDEPAQATYIHELLTIFDDAGVDSTFVFVFSLNNFPHNSHGDDLDLASPAITKYLPDGHGTTYPDLPWEPKAAFSTLADYYRGDTS